MLAAYWDALGSGITLNQKLRQISTIHSSDLTISIWFLVSSVKYSQIKQKKYTLKGLLFKKLKVPAVIRILIAVFKHLIDTRDACGLVEHGQ